MRFAPVLVVLAACGPGPEAEAFGFVGELRNHPQRGTVISLWMVGTADPSYLFKFGDGTTVLDQFDMSYPSDPPAAAINSDGVGVAMMALLPGLATLPDGRTSLDELVLDGLTQAHAVVWKAPGAIGPAWAAAFPEGFSCGACLPGTSLDALGPVDCSFLLLQPPPANFCVYY
jgi:hypothetical protein